MYSQDVLKERILMLIASKSEDEQSALMKEISGNVLDPYWADYIFQTDDYLNDDDSINFEMLFERIFSYRPIHL